MSSLEQYLFLSLAVWGFFGGHFLMNMSDMCPRDSAPPNLSHRRTQQVRQVRQGPVSMQGQAGAKSPSTGSVPKTYSGRGDLSEPQMDLMPPLPSELTVPMAFEMICSLFNLPHPSLCFFPFLTPGPALSPGFSPSH